MAHFSLRLAPLLLCLAPLPTYPHRLTNEPTIFEDHEEETRTEDQGSCGDFEDHPLVLVSMDGFRADFLSRGLTPTIASLAHKGVHAPFIKPSYPTITFPNHYTIVTGLIPPSHGIIANRFTDPLLNASFAPGRPESFQKRFWGGEPIWKTVENQGQIAATYFWPGSEVVGLRPTFWTPFVKHAPFVDRVNQVLAWLDLPATERPRFLTLYFQEPDDQGHDFGPDSPQINEALRLVDEAILMLVNGLKKRGIFDCVNLVIVADHGMSAAGPDRVINLNDVVPQFSSRVDSLWNGVFVRFNAKNRTTEGTTSLMSQLSCQRKDLHVYHRDHAPARWHLGGQGRIEDIVLDLAKGIQADGDGTYKPDMGDHGYDNYISDMNALFLARGPAFKQQIEVEAFQNTELYNLFCLLTGVSPAPNNGTWGALHHLLLHPPTLHQTPIQATPTIPQIKVKEEATSIEASGEEWQQCGRDYLGPAYWLSTQERPAWYLARHAPFGLPRVPENLLNKMNLLPHPTHLTGYSHVHRTPLYLSFTVEEHFSNPITAPKKQKAPLWQWDRRFSPSQQPPICDATPQGYEWKSPYFSDTCRWGTGQCKIGLASSALLMTEPLGSVWGALVQTLAQWARFYRGLNVAVGPAFDHDGDTIADAFREGSPKAPTHLWVVVTRCMLGHGNLRHCPPQFLDAMAFILPQKLMVPNCLTPSEYLREFSAKVSDVELISGLRFFPSLPAEDAIRLRIRVHSNLWRKETWANRIKSDLFNLKKK